MSSTPRARAGATLAERGQTVRAEPFDAIELPVSGLFGDEG